MGRCSARVEGRFGRELVRTNTPEHSPIFTVCRMISCKYKYLDGLREVDFRDGAGKQEILKKSVRRKAKNGIPGLGRGAVGLFKRRATWVASHGCCGMRKNDNPKTQVQTPNLGHPACCSDW
jgi:hypothetical protein